MMQLLDLFCGAGGCSVGYARAGFTVTGVDVEPHPSYPFMFRRADALEVLADGDFLASFDAIHASPPCQAYTTMSNRWRGAGGMADGHADLIADVRKSLEEWGGWYVIENVPGARRQMRHPITLHGGMFGLSVYRPRLFESNAPLMGYNAPPPVNPIGVYGKAHDGRRLFSRSDGTQQRAAATLKEGQEAMGIDWMSWDDLTEAIPPAYTEFIGRQLMDLLRSEARQHRKAIR